MAAPRATAEIDDPAELAAVVARLAAAQPALRAMAVEERIAIIDRVAARWLALESPWRRAALTLVPSRSHHGAVAVAAALDHLWGALRHDGIAPVADLELHGPAAPAGLALHVLSGNVPGAGVFGIVAALVAGVPCLVKVAGREPVLPALIADSLAAADRRMGDALAALAWHGGRRDLDTAAVAAADVVLAYGRAPTLAAISALGARRLLAFGPRVSVAVVAAEAVHPSTAAAAARQVALFDQQGCLSPQLVIAEEATAGDGDLFAEALAAALAELAITMPRGPVPLVEESAVWRFLETQRWREQEGAPVRVHADVRGRFSVVCDRSGTPPASPLNRHVVVAPVARLESAAALLAPLAPVLEAVGYAGPEWRLANVAALAARSGAHRLCPLERMQVPPFAWRQSGHARFEPFSTPLRPAPDDPICDRAAAAGAR